MNITLSTGTRYNLNNSQHKRRLRKYIPQLRERDQTEELNIICKQMENAAMLDRQTLELYHLAKNTMVETTEFATGYYAPSADEKNNTNNRYSFIHGKFYRLPVAKNDEAVVYALLTKYGYERCRNERNSDVCLNLRRAINKFIPGATKKSDNELRKILTAHETASKTYYGDCLSDDSDSEEEETFKALPVNKKEKKLKQAKRHRSHAKAATYQAAMDGASNPPRVDFKTRSVIPRASDFDRRAVEADLKRINEQLEKEGKLSPDFLASLGTQFVCAQYRGVHYAPSLWGAGARRKHRAMNESKKPQYSGAVFASCGITSYAQYLEKSRLEPDLDERMSAAATDIASLLLRMQHSGPVSWDGFAYVSLFHLLQYWYSSDYNSFPKKLEAEFRKANSLFTPFLRNTSRPLLSTADTLYHALRYAFGSKIYAIAHELDPCWGEDGRAERPYVGKVYVSLHPLSEYTECNPSHITSMYKQGLMKLNNFIAPERETSYLGGMSKNKVVLQHIAKFPSFKGNYKSIYEYKYGISEAMYKKLQTAFQNFPPHSSKRANLKLVLSEYLCAYHEVRLIEKTELEARKKGAVLVYRDENGKFSLYHPDTPHTANKRLYPIVMAKRRLYEALAPDKAKCVTPLTKQQIQNSLATALPGEKNAEQRETEWARFFTSKSTFASNEKVVPVRTFTR